MWLTALSSALALLAAGVVVCCAVVAQSQEKDQKLDPAVLLDAPTVPQMVVDSAGTLHLARVRFACLHSPVRKPDKPTRGRCYSGREPRARPGFRPGGGGGRAPGIEREQGDRPQALSSGGGEPDSFGPREMVSVRYEAFGTVRGTLRHGTAYID
jgi:hypothetical protein